MRTAYLLKPCSAVHTFGMAYPIDVLFCDAAGTILRIVPGLPPWRVARHAHAAAVWELRAGSAEQWGWRVGDRISPC
jgi:uncharacterized membrane protein (UPF0127 family)